MSNIPPLCLAGAEVRYSVYSGDPDGWFSVDPASGALRTAARLDHERHTFVLLNMQAVSGQPPIYGHAQVSGPSGRKRWENSERARADRRVGYAAKAVSCNEGFSG